MEKERRMPCEEQTAMDLEKHIQKREEDMKETEKAPCDQE
jgi:hypothetical protein